MIQNDFDLETQDIFDEQFSNLRLTDWKKWLNISSKEEYIELVLKNSGLASIPDLFERLGTEKTHSKSLSIDLYNYIKNDKESQPLVVCHSSGTTNSSLAALKWFHMSKEVAQKYWAPGMQAIFESSGLNSDSSVVIFVPSRLNMDGIKIHENIKYLSLYSSEFSQRLMLSLLKPLSYTFYEYRKAKDIDIISKILSLKNVSAISAPSATILGWADIRKLKLGINKSLKLLERPLDEKSEILISKIKRKGIDQAVKEIQQKLSKKLSKATLVFSVSSLSENDWKLIRTFMKWEKGQEKFTNLYVASEIGPFAASIERNQEGQIVNDFMNVFPLTLPVIENSRRKQFISETDIKRGNLLISKTSMSKAYINLEIGDVIEVVDQEALPQIAGRILRSSFQLRYPIKISRKIYLPKRFKVYAGDFFSFDQYEIYNPRTLLNCLINKCDLDFDAMLLIEEGKDGGKRWRLILLTNELKECSKLKSYKKNLLKCTKDEKFKEALSDQRIDIQLIDENPVDFLATRSKILDNVRKGKNPKGILKKWPLYVIKT